MAAADVSISRTSLDACYCVRGENTVAVYDVLPVLGILTDGKGSPLTFVAHVAEKEIIC